MRVSSQDSSAAVPVLRATASRCALSLVALLMAANVSAAQLNAGQRVRVRYDSERSGIDRLLQGGKETYVGRLVGQDSSRVTVRGRSAERPFTRVTVVGIDTSLGRQPRPLLAALVGGVLGAATGYLVDAGRGIGHANAQAAQAVGAGLCAGFGGACTAPPPPPPPKKTPILAFAAVGALAGLVLDAAFPREGWQRVQP